MHDSLKGTDKFNERRKCMFKRPLKSMFKSYRRACLRAVEQYGKRGQIVGGQ